MILMTVGFGFGSLLIGTVAERFLAQDLRAEGTEVERDVQTAEADLLGELDDISARVRLIEVRARPVRAVSRRTRTRRFAARGARRTRRSGSRSS